MSNTQIEPPHVDPAVVSNVPSGMMMPYAGASAPSGFLMCDGSAVSRSVYASLFTAVGTTWGPGDGSTTFNVPDCRGRTAFGKDASGTFQTMAGTGGSETHNHTAASHTHSVLNHSHNGPTHGHGNTSSDGAHTHTGGAGGGLLSNSAGTLNTDSQGSHVHSIVSTSISTSAPDLSTTSDATTVGTSTDSAVNPYIVFNFIIKV